MAVIQVWVWAGLTVLLLQKFFFFNRRRRTLPKPIPEYPGYRAILARSEYEGLSGSYQGATRADQHVTRRRRELGGHLPGQRRPGIELRRVAARVVAGAWKASQRRSLPAAAGLRKAQCKKAQDMPGRSRNLWYQSTVPIPLPLIPAQGAPYLAHAAFATTH